MKAGLALEFELAGQLTMLGWLVHRTANSRGPFDLVALRKDETRLIQVKSTRNPKAAPYCYLQAIERLRALAAPQAITKWLYVFVQGQGWRGRNIATWPSDRSTLRRCLKAWVRDTEGSWWNPAPLVFEAP